MAKSELYNNSLLPLVLVTAILSGGLWRSGPSGESAKPGESASGGDKTDVAPPPAPWVSDLRPAMESLAAALGVNSTNFDEDVVADAAGVELEEEGWRREHQVVKALSELRTGLDQTPKKIKNGPTASSCAGAFTSVDRPAKVLAASLLVDDGRVKTRTAAVNALLDEYRDWRLLQSLACNVRKSKGSAIDYDVNFIVASVPDYVDSNSGWQADQSLAAIQSGMTRRLYLFDRVKLIDWSRSVQGSASVLSGSRLHERQPGIMIFRKVDLPEATSAGPDARTTIHLQVVLLVLETPTAGIHQTALRNSLSFLEAWNAYRGISAGPLRVLGPTFSGSIVSLASVLGEDAVTNAFDRRLVITGSANADNNAERMKALSKRAIYLSAVQPTSVLMERMAAFLGAMNADWKDGRRVALLTESNTAYGAGAGAEPPEYFPGAQTFHFPLHVAQLRSDAPALPQPGAALLPNAIVPLNMREPSPPTDLVPALRPQLTSPVVESTIDSIFDTIRHERITAVGIVATDNRDVLFLARELKRASPDVQLFLFGNHALYLHQDYVPYLRGALVASSYSLSLANQPEINDGSNRKLREPFQSMAAEGTVHAIQALVSSSEGAADVSAMAYCRGGATDGCMPVAPVSINVIGEDGYWTLPANTSESSTSPTRTPPPIPYGLPPLPVRTLIGAGLIGVFVIAHLVVLYLIRLELRFRKGRRGLTELPLVRVFAPPRTAQATAHLHLLAVMICFALLALAAAWVMVITLPFLSLGSTARFLAMQVSALIFGGFICAAAALYEPSKPRARTALPPVVTAGDPIDQSEVTQQQHPICVWTGWLLFAGMLLTLGTFFWVIVELGGWSTSAHDRDLVLARMVGGGIVSPAALTLTLVAALYTSLITGIRRLSLVGKGYEELSKGSRAFDLLIDRPASKGTAAETPYFAAFLDMPSRTMPPVYPLAVLLTLIIASIGAWHVSTIEGTAFSWFVRIGSLTALGLGLLLLAQGVATWTLARSCLKRLAHSALEPHFTEIAPHVPWDISLAPPRLTEMMPVARMADDVMHDFQTLSAATPHVRAGRDIHRRQDKGLVLRSDTPRRIGVRDGDMLELKPLTAFPSHVLELRAEMAIRQHASLMQSTTWFSLWRLSDAIVTLLDKTHWQRAGTDIPAGTVKARHSRWFASCERLVALQVAFVLRDIVARTITFLFAALLCLTLLTASHLFYSFNGRASILTVDLLAVAGTALAAVWILVDMERDHVLSRLKTTTPGRVDLNWDFMRRLGIYGVLPLLAVVAALFPEVGGTLFGWLEPLRKLSSF